MNDSITSLKEFLIGNRTNPGLQGFMIHTGWLEGNLNYELQQNTPSNSNR